MNTERKPLLSDEDIRIVYSPYMKYRIKQGMEGMDVRDYYEDLITTGKLRVVEEVECRNTGKDEAWCEWLKCPCGESTRVGSNYCPGCGNKIKRA
jgi:hypothetical protein